MSMYCRLCCTLMVVLICASLNHSVVASSLPAANTPLAVQPCAPIIDYGDTLQCSFVSSSETDSFSFSASANDKVLIRTTRITGTITPQFDVQQEGSSVKICGGISQATCTIPTTANYIIRTSDRSVSGSGDYHLYIQRLNNPGKADSVVFGIDYSRILTITAQIDTSYFPAQANDVVLVRMIRTSGTPNPDLNVYDSNGIFVCGGLGASATCKLPSDGNYTILSQGNGGSGSMGYVLYLQRINNPANAILLRYGDSKNGVFVYPYQSQSFAFLGLANEKVVVRMTRTSGDIYPKFSVYDPTGKGTCGGVAGNAAQATCVLPYDGVYTIITGDQAGGNLGGYSMNVTCQVGVCGVLPAVFVPIVVR